MARKTTKTDTQADGYTKALAEMPSKTSASGLPVMVVSPADVGRLTRELEVLDDTLLQLKLRGNDSASELPEISHLLKQTLQINKLNPLIAWDRAALRTFLATIKECSPVLHMSFSIDPSPVFMERLMTWLRRELHPQLLVTIGLQPTIGAGCIIRTANKQFDFSLREDFIRKRDLLLDQLTASSPHRTKTTETA